MSLTTIRADLAAALSTDAFPVHDHMPERVMAPCGLIGAADPYVVHAAELGDAHIISHEVWLVAGGKGSNDAKTERLDELIEHALGALPDEWTADSVTAPFIAQLNDSLYLAVRLKVSALTTIN